MEPTDIRRSRLKVGHRFFTGWKVGKYAFLTDTNRTFAWAPGKAPVEVPWTLPWRPKGVSRG